MFFAASLALAACTGSPKESSTPAQTAPQVTGPVAVTPADHYSDDSITHEKSYPITNDDGSTYQFEAINCAHGYHLVEMSTPGQVYRFGVMTFSYMGTPQNTPPASQSEFVLSFGDNTSKAQAKERVSSVYTESMYDFTPGVRVYGDDRYVTVTGHPEMIDRGMKFEKKLFAPLEHHYVDHIGICIK